MKGMYRKIDQLGRIVLPIEIRRSFGLEPGSEVDIRTLEYGILLSPRAASCTCCGSMADLLNVDGITLCRNCARRLAAALNEGWTGK